MTFNRLNHNVLGEIRPRFRLSTSLQREEVFALIRQQLKQDATVHGAVLKQYAILKIPQSEAHYWSPELQIRIDEEESDADPEATILRCLIGPKQTVWSLFVFFYALVGVISFFGGMYGLSQLTIGQSSWFIWLFPVGLALIPTIWLVAKVGQKAGREQMLHLVSFLYHALEERGNVERVR